MRLLYIFLSLFPIVLGNPTVSISFPQSTIVSSSTSILETFIGIPFASPPTGSLLLKPPQALTQSFGTVDATAEDATACPQFFFTNDPDDFPTGVLGELLDTHFIQEVTNSGEDCLTINVIRPTGATETSQLPVLF